MNNTIHYSTLYHSNGLYFLSGIDIKVTVLPAPGQVILNFYLPKDRSYLPEVMKSPCPL